MKSFKEMLADESGQRELDQIIHETPKLESEHNDIMTISNRLEQNIDETLKRLLAVGDMTDYDVLSDNEKIALNARLRELRDQVFDKDMMHKFVDMAHTPLRFLAYGILENRECEKLNQRLGDFDEWDDEIENIIFTTPELKIEKQRVKDIRNAVDDLFNAINSFSCFSHYEQFMFTDMLTKIVDAAHDNLQYEAYKILRERKKVGDEA